MSPKPRRGEAKPVKLDWLARAIARAGVMPLAEAEDAVKEGRVTVAGRLVRQPMAAVKEGELVRLDGHALNLVAKTRVLAYHKPAGIDVTHKAERDKTPTVFEKLAELLTPELGGYTWHAVGRLDRDTTGLLLFTNDERVVAHVTSPDTKLEKAYRAHVQGRPTAERLAPLMAGMPIDDFVSLPAQVTVIGPHEVDLVLVEGKNHQAKKMLGAVGFPVTSLVRTRIGKVVLDIADGALRELSDEEIRDGLGFA